MASTCAAGGEPADLLSELVCDRSGGAPSSAQLRDSAEAHETLRAGVLDEGIGFELDDAPHVDTTRGEGVREFSEIGQSMRRSQDVARNRGAMRIEHPGQRTLLTGREHRRSPDGVFVPSIEGVLGGAAD